MSLNYKFMRVGQILLAAAALSVCGSLAAQDAAPPPPPGPPHGGHFGFGPGGPGADEMMRFVGFEAGLGGKTVTGAPFSASFTTSESQTLADGNQINRNTSGTIARDSEGRTRRDMTLAGIGRFTEGGQSAPPHVVLINDVVAGKQYVLQPDRKVAHAMARPKWKGRNHGAGAGGPSDDATAGTRNRPNVTTSSLGTQTIAGVQAEGTLTTRTIPAGAVGNAKPIIITTERWYSPELQTVVMVKRNDPYVGTSEFQLTNVQRQEPESSLFQVPADYTVRGGGAGKRGFKSGAGAPPPPPADDAAPAQN
jgi:hypothetical protein